MSHLHRQLAAQAALAANAAEETPADAVRVTPSASPTGAAPRRKVKGKARAKKKA